VDDLSILIEIQSLITRHSDRLSRAIIFVEERDGIATRYDSGALIFKQKLAGTFQYRRVVAMALQRYACEKAA